MAVEYARVERCGRVALGEYCLHLHLVGDCPTCAVRGNVVEGGVNKGITIHGTHNATVEKNVVFDLRGASIYVEDGNELHNSISHNLLLCPSLSHKAQLGGLERDRRHRHGHRCGLYGVDEHADSDQRAGGIYVLSATNHLIGNHVSGHDNAFFANHQAGATTASVRRRADVCRVGPDDARQRLPQQRRVRMVRQRCLPNAVRPTQGYVTNWESASLRHGHGRRPRRANAGGRPRRVFNDFAMGATTWAT